MKVTIRFMEANDAPLWDEYVYAHPKAVVYHLSGWKNVIYKTYGHRTYYLMALKGNPAASTSPITGILPLVHLKHFLFGNSLISMPFFDLGGILADNAEVEEALLNKAVRLGASLKINRIELRQSEPLSLQAHLVDPRHLQIRTHKVRMLLKLPDPGEDLIGSFKSKLRNQILKPMKQGLHVKTGGRELLEDFYHIFLIHMRDLGSPAHSIKLMRYTLAEFPEQAKIMVVYKNDQAMAGSLVVGFKDTLENPWASALRKYNPFNPNMLLYWNMLQYAHVRGFPCFDFGRSSPGESAYRFKAQWGAQATPLYWHSISAKDKAPDETAIQKDKFQKAVAYWKKMPVPITKILGPRIRKYIGL